MLNLFLPNKETSSGLLSFLVQDAVQELVFYLYQHPKCRLKEIRTAFQKVDYKLLDEMIERLIRYSYVERKDRNYQLCLPTYTDANVKQDKKKVEEWIEKIQITIEKTAPQALAELALLFPKENEQNLYERWTQLVLLSLFSSTHTETLVVNTTEDFRVTELQHLSTDKYTFIETVPLFQEQANLVAYFNALKYQCIQINNIEQQNLLAVTGDVNIEYFLNKCGRLIKRSVRKTLNEDTSNNIFYQVLVDTQWLDKTGEFSGFYYPKKAKLSLQNIISQWEKEWEVSLWNEESSLLKAFILHEWLQQYSKTTHLRLLVER